MPNPRLTPDFYNNIDDGLTHHFPGQIMTQYDPSKSQILRSAITRPTLELFYKHPLMNYLE